MDTKEHTELGNALRLDTINDNPYLRKDEQGVLYLHLQRFGEEGLPESMPLELSAGEIIAMAGDYYTQADWTMDLDLPNCEDFESAEELGFHLVEKPIEEKETTALIMAYNNLAAPHVSREDIDTIYSINNTQYIPFSSTLNSYIQQIMLNIRVKNYGEMLVRNQSHFSPWSVRAYLLGHSIALRYAHLSYELKQLAGNSNYYSDNPDLIAIKHYLLNNNPAQTKEELIDLAHRYHAQAYSIELFSFHYYSDHYATGHMSMVGDLRVILPEKFGTLGSILANNIHDELNRIGIYTYRPYDPTPDPTEPPTRAHGDGTFDTCLNESNKKQCIEGMSASLQDINHVLSGGPVPDQKTYGGLEHMPDVDYNIRQPEPLLVFRKGKVYYRSNLKKINILSPSEYDALRDDPLNHGYTELTSKWSAFLLVFKLRVLSYFYTSEVQPVSVEKLTKILEEEKQRNPKRLPIPEESCTPDSEPTAVDWHTHKEAKSRMAGLTKQGLFKLPTSMDISTKEEPRPSVSLAGV